MDCGSQDEVGACPTSTVKDSQCQGHPRLTDPCVEYWTKWDEWTPGLKDSFQERQICKMENFIRHSLQVFMSLEPELIGAVNIPAVSFPEEIAEDASYEEKQRYLIDSYNVAMDIALPKKHDRWPRQRRLLQTSLTQYRPLYQELKLEDPTTAIRLLEVLPGPPDNPVIKTRLFNASLHSLGHKYEALSYAWGKVASLREMRSIHVNSFKLPVTPNLYNALISLRQPDRARVLWVDSVCINQGDLNERREQILLIAHIYSRSERTVVFLGPSTAKTHAFFTFLSLPICQLSHCEKCQKNHAWPSRNQGPVEACAEAALDEQDVVDGFVQVCSMSWWTRVWILQEFMLSRTDPLIHCGRDAVSNRQLTVNLDYIYDWIYDRKTHPEPVIGCTAYGGNVGLQADDVSEDGSEDNEHSTTSENGEGANDLGGDDLSVASGNSGDKEDYFEVVRRRLRGLSLAPRSTDGHQWNIWGARVWLVKNVLNGRTLCRPWNGAQDVYKSLTSSCSDPHDIVYGVRELADHAFRDMFIPDYTISVPDLYTKLATYLIMMEHWSDLFWHYPHRLKDKYPRGSQESTSIPSWVPDFTRRVQPKAADRVPDDGAKQIRSNPFIVDRVLFCTGWVLDEIFQVFPLPKNDPFRLLQQLWYVERAHGWTPYEVMSGKPSSNFHDWDKPKDTKPSLTSVHPFPSVTWATDRSSSSDGRSIVQTLELCMDLEGIIEVFDRSVTLATPCLQRIFDREGKSYGPSASREERDEFFARASGIRHRLFDLMMEFMCEGDKRTDFIGICTFDFEGLRAQVLHNLIPMTPWQPLRMNRPKFVNEEVDNICNPPFFNADLQRPIVYRSLLALINKGTEDVEERIMRREVVMNFAQVGQGEVTYEYLGDNPHNDDGINAGGREDLIVDHFVLSPFNGHEADSSRPDGPLILCQSNQEDDDPLLEKMYFDEAGQPLGPRPVEGACSFKILNKSSMMSEPRHRASSIYGDNSSASADDSNAFADDELNAEPQRADGDLEDRDFPDEAQRHYPTDPAVPPVEESEEATHSKNETYDTVSSSKKSRPSLIRGGPSGKLSSWRRTEKRKSTQVHLVFQDLCDFLAGREFFITETGLMGLTAPGVRGVCDGDDLLMLQDMAFPIVARLEPSEKLGNPKMRRRSMPTLRMRREIVGSAIVRGIDTKGGQLDKVEFPDHFEPLSSMSLGFLRIK
uniref:Heterokaryon incompatibility domain-containing protein n=1 Tax=Bionectria ochroleuca TaxID=29856 RepID=A0A8H7TQ73_BIOOC